MNQTLVECACMMLNNANLPKKYWGDVIIHAINLLLNYAWGALLLHLRIFRCKAHVHVPDEKQKKLDAKWDNN
ncbi:hypothetical protein EDC04DRAFT_2785742 [Pisolithus marmoratus]|nr:hypothetical protein EDC04DRAFT_2785742 [Pisolithus marmoratus]